MKRALTILCAVALLATSCTSEPSKKNKADDSARVIVLGIDGGTWTVIEPMMEAGELPNLRKLYDSGLHGILESRPPILSPVVWTTIFSGFGYQKHGIKDWKTSQSVNRKVNAIWEILRDQDKRVDVFNVPATWPPDPIKGSMLSGFPLSGATFGGNTGDELTAEELESPKGLTAAYRENIDIIRQTAATIADGAWSDWLPAKISTRPQFRGVLRIYRFSKDRIYVTPLYRVDDGLVISEPKKLRGEIAKKIGEPYIPEGPGWSKWAEPYVPDVLYDHLEQVFSIQSKAVLEFAGGDWQLLLYVMTLVDRVSHPYWAYGHPEKFPNMDPEKAKKYGGVVKNAYRRTDEELGRILAKVKGDPYVVIVSDHGFQSSTDSSKPIGTHNPDGIYLVAGPGIKKQTGVPKFIEDVTPTLLYLMGMPTARDMDGSVFPEVIDALGRKVETVPSYEKTQRDSTDEPVDSDTWESLRGLGYVDGAPPRAADKDKKPEDAAPANGAAPKPGAKSDGAAKPGAQQKADGHAPEAPPANVLEDWPEEPHPHPEDEPKPATPNGEKQ